MQRDTVGKLSSELLLKSPETRDPIELEREMQQLKYIDNLIQCVTDHKDKFIDNFYVVVITKREPLMPNVFRNYFFPRNTCPTPDYDQSLFHYNKNDEHITYLWTIPTRDVCHHLIDNALYVHPNERKLLDFVLQFANGSLFKLAKKLNGEIEESIQLQEK